MDMGESGVGLTQKHCVPCKGGVPPLRGEELEKLSAELPDWKVTAEHHLTKMFVFPDFKTALAFVNRAGAIAEAEGHHRSEEHMSELQSPCNLVCRLLLEKKKNKTQ